MSVLFSTGVTKFAKDSRDRLLFWRYNQNLKQIIKKKMQAFQWETGPLNIENKKKCDDYALDVLGWKGYSIGLQLYTLRAGKFKEGWIPENYFYNKVMPEWQGKYGQISHLRCLTTKLFKDTVNLDLAYLVNNRWHTNDLNPISEDQLLNTLRKSTEKVVYKLDNSYQGRGIIIQETKKINLNYLKSLGNGVLQNFVCQHEFFNQFTTNSVSCIRLTTVITLKGEPEIRGAFLRLGQSSDSHVQYNSEIAVSINLQTGILDTIGYNSDWTSCSIHPDHKVKFEDKKIPCFNKMVKTALDLHLQMPLVGVIGWDLIINDNDEIVMMEWNGYGSDVAFSEITQGPCFTGLGWEQKGEIMN
jgi:hypothetical protein